MNYFQNIVQKYIWEPAVHVNTSSEAIVQYITTFGFATIYYLGIANLFVGMSLLYNVHKSLIHSFPTYMQEFRDTVSVWVPFLAPNITQYKGKNQIDTSEGSEENEENMGIPNVSSNPCNLDLNEENTAVERSNVIEEWCGEDSSESESTDEGVRPPANSTDSNIDPPLQTSQQIIENIEDTIDGRTHTD